VSALHRFAAKIKMKLRGSAPVPILSPPDRIIGVEQARMMLTVRLYAREDNGRLGHVVLGPGVYLGRNVELATALGGDLVVGRTSSIQDNCVFHGDVVIGAHCTFGANVMISTTTHRFRDHPAWLITDQDAAVQATQEKPSDYNRPVTIEDDCWLGWGSAVMPGVTIGRGAVVGANCVVTRDIGPYEIHGGVPNRLLGKRLDFAPPRAISCRNDADIPYFYRGFRLRRSELEQNRENGIACSQAHTALVLAGSATAVRIEGNVAGNDLVLEPRINGRLGAVQRLAAGPFIMELPVKTAGSGPLGAFTVVELVDLSHAATPLIHRSDNRYAIQTAALN
jgi:acetyltransferase-like isoleucine patch superfamily enzyme